MARNGKDDIRNVLLKINRAGRTLIDTGEGLYLVDHTDKEGIIKRKEGQEGFQCVAKIGTEGLRKGEIEELKKEITDEIIRDKTGISGVLESHGYSERLQNSDSIDAEVRRSNADNVGLDQETPQGESLGVNPEHPIHEYTHLWDRALYGMDPDHKILRVEEMVSVQNRI